MLNKSYRQLHEEFVVSKTGTTPWQCLLLVSPYPLLAFFACFFVNLILRTKSGLCVFLTEFVIMILPMVVSLTLYHSHNLLFVMGLVIAIFISLISSLWNKRKNLIKIVFTLVTPVKSRPFITYFRSIVNLISVFCILAVDFHVFPRHLAKTHSYGFGLMDTGVGFFVIANGIVAKYDTKEDLFKTIKNICPIIALGIFRLFSVKSLEYQEVVSEYGTHWNFFFTLAAVKLMAIFLMNIFPNKELWLALFLGTVHHCILQYGVEGWVMSDLPRTNPFSANREGFCSLFGYLSLYFSAMALGKVLQRDFVDLQKDMKQASKGFFISVFLYAAVFWLHSRYPVSRRLANVTYIVWMLSMTILLLSVCIVIETCLRIINFVNGITTENNLAPTILNSINYNGLVFFLLGNIFTGIVNIWLQTMYVDTLNSIITLTVYMFLLCFFANIFYKNHIKFSF